jgi:hypothetical protein
MQIQCLNNDITPAIVSPFCLLRTQEGEIIIEIYTDLAPFNVISRSAYALSTPRCRVLCPRAIIVIANTLVNILINNKIIFFNYVIAFHFPSYCIETKGFGDNNNVHTYI